jgi:glycosyltransferase involved in cell wall biosynthesis
MIPGAPLVSVSMLTYNHEKYIAQAIESVLKQKTDFPIELIIGEDCSTDGTRAIVDAYAGKHPGIIRVLTGQANVGALANAIRVTNACRGKYLATLEGDDFWNDELKLQKQVDFLEHNPEYGLVHSDVNHWYEEDGTLVENYNAVHHIHIPEGDIFNEMLDPKKYIIKTPTAVFRKDLHDRYVHYEIIREKGWALADLFSWLSMVRRTKVKYIPQALATYRILKESAGNSADFQKKLKLHQSVYAIMFYFAAKYDCNELVLNKIKTYYIHVMVRDAFKTFDKKLSAEIKKYAQDNKISPGIKDRLFYYGTKNRKLNNLLNKIW